MAATSWAWACSGEPGGVATGEGDATGEREQPVYGSQVTTGPAGGPAALGAVGQLTFVRPSGGTNQCTGTLVTATQMLTAAHCMCDPLPPLPSATTGTFSLGAATGTFTAVANPEYGCRNQPFMSSTAVDGVALFTDTAPFLFSPLDVAFATVTVTSTVAPGTPTPLPPPAPISIAAGATTPGLVAGFSQNPHASCGASGLEAKTCSLQSANPGVSCAPQPAQLRWGAYESHLVADTCDELIPTCLTLPFGGGTHCLPVAPGASEINAIDEGLCWSHPFFAHRVDEAVAPEVELAKGDSGGPLFMTFNGRQRVVGVYSGVFRSCVPGDGAGPLDSLTSMHAALLVNAAFVGAQVPRAVMDSDGDGVSDELDRCQGDVDSGVDADNDGVDDACDNCTAANTPGCASNPALCANPGQRDIDGDGRGDLCDPCPQATTPAIFADADADGTPDACDAANGKDDPAWPTCTTDAGASMAGDCPIALGGNQCLLDSPGLGVCTKHPDGDIDGIPDFADLCPAFTSKDNTNSNAQAETAFTASVKGDPCDPAPVMRVVANPPIDGSTPSAPGPVSVSVSSWVGKTTPSFTPPAGFSSTFTANHTASACSCVDDQGVLQPLSRCVAPGLTGAACPSDTPQGPKWLPATVREDDPGAPALPATGKAAAFNDGTEGAVESFYWDWQADIASGAIPSTWKFKPAAYQEHVDAPPATHFQTARESGSDLRSSYALTHPGAFAAPYVVGPVDSCLPPCGIALFDPRRLANPEFFVTFPEREAQRGLPSLLLPAGDSIHATVRDRRIDVTTGVAASLREAIRTSSVRWFAPVETYRTLVKTGDHTAPVASLPKVLTGLAAPSRLRVGPGGLGPEIPSIGDGDSWPLLPIAASVSGDASDPSGLTDFEAAYSATEHSVYVAGGAQPNGATSLYRYDLDRRRWRVVTRLGPGADTRALTYDPEAKRLHALTRREGVLELRAFDTTDGSSARLATLRERGRFERVHLTLLPGGDLLLTGAKARAYELHRFRVAQGRLVLLASAHRPGVVVSQPATGYDDVFVPVRRPNARVEMVVVGAMGTRRECDDL